MQDFYKRALIALACLVSASLLAGYVCVQWSYLRLHLISDQGNSIPWHLESSSDVEKGGSTRIRVLGDKSRLHMQFAIAKAVAYPFATAALVFEDRNRKPALVDLSRYTSISLEAKCSPANTLTLRIPTFDPKVSKVDDLVSYRTPSSYFSCNENGVHAELDLTRLETPQWWFDMYKLDISHQAYKLDKVPRILFSSTFQSPAHVSSTVELGDITLHGRDFRPLYFLGIFLVTVWGGYGLWFFRQHALALVESVKDKLQRDLPLVAYQQLSVEPHRDKEKSAVVRFIASNYARQDLDLETVVSRTGVNRNKINDILRAELGFTFTGYLNKLRVTEAARLLAEKDTASVAEIAYSVGYGNVSYFNKLFKEEYRCTPKAFRSLSGKQAETWPDAEGINQIPAPAG